MLVDSGRHRAVPDRLVTVVLPPEVTHDKRSLPLRGHVMRVSSSEAGTDEIAVLFELLREAARKRLETIVSTHRHGPAVLDKAAALALSSVPVISEDAEPVPVTSEDADPFPVVSEDAEPFPIVSEDGDLQPSDLEDPEDEVPGERRIQDRHAITRRIIALGDEAARVLIGRDLSIGGMRIDSTPDLALGDHLKVAVHVRPDGQPLVVSAEIVRDDGPAGMALRFVDLSPAAHAYLEEMVGALPSIVESNGSKEGAGLLVSELVGRRAS
jgi:hypothetical protein